ncbi:MAG: tRNA (N(6)-L-threonylcarbamoyladenosine(37)-C(2))-methylthiotransferase [Candidatus Hermodarchaeota archaeon]
MEHNKFYIETYGCTSNKADSYIITNLLKKSNYLQSNLDDANFIIINTCGVKQQTENKIKTRLESLHNLFSKNPDKFIIIAGCLPFIDHTYIDVIRKIVPNFSAIVDLDSIHEFPKILKQIKQGNTNLIIKTKELIDKTNFLIDFAPGKITGIVPISEGCLGACTYCCVKSARGRLNCYEPEKIIKNVKYQLKQGIKQIYLTSQDCSIYKYNHTELVDIIKDITNLNYKFFLRIGMLNPRFLIKNLDQLIAIFNLKKVYQFLHIPIQSGSNNILKKMNRSYRISEITNRIEVLRKHFPLITISTDIICGFPGETEEDFRKTIELIEWLKPEILNISKFTPRPGTKAKEMKQIDGKIIKERSKRLSKIFRDILINSNKEWENWEGEVLTLHEGEKNNQVFGRNFAYKNIFIEGFKGNYGDFTSVNVYKVNGFNLFAKVI